MGVGIFFKIGEKCIFNGERNRNVILPERNCEMRALRTLIPKYY
jgi:hypothetical protein